MNSLPLSSLVISYDTLQGKPLLTTFSCNVVILRNQKLPIYPKSGVFRATLMLHTATSGSIEDQMPNALTLYLGRIKFLPEIDIPSFPQFNPIQRASVFYR